MQACRRDPAKTPRSLASGGCLHESERVQLAHKAGGESLLTIQHGLLPGLSSGAGDASPARQQALSAGKVGKVPQIHPCSLNDRVCNATEPWSWEKPHGGSWGCLPHCQSPGCAAALLTRVEQEQPEPLLRFWGAICHIPASGACHPPPLRREALRDQHSPMGNAGQGRKATGGNFCSKPVCSGDLMRLVQSSGNSCSGGCWN